MLIHVGQNTSTLGGAVGLYVSLFMCAENIKAASTVAKQTGMLVPKGVWRLVFFIYFYLPLLAKCVNV